MISTKTLRCITALIACCSTVSAVSALDTILELPTPLAEGQTLASVRKSFPLEASTFKNVNSHHPAVEAINTPDGLKLIWNGQMVWMPAGPLGGVLEGSEQIPVEFGPAGKIRVRLTYDVLEFESDSEVVFDLFCYDQAGNRIASMEIMPPDYLTYFANLSAPERPKFFTRTLTPPAETAKVGVGFRFKGNKIQLNIREIAVEPAPDPMEFRLQKNTLVPDVQYIHDDLQPAVDQIKLTDEEVTALLAERPCAYPKLEKRNERIVLSINGKEMPPAISFSPGNGIKFAQMQNMEAIGMQIHTLKVRLGPMYDSLYAPHSLWVGPDQFDFEPLAKEIRHLLSRVPDAYIILDLSVNVPNWWGEANPGDIHTDKEGKRAVTEWSRVNRYGGAKPSGREGYEANNFSEKFREDGRNALTALGEWLNSTPEGKVVIGAYLNGACDGQWFFSNEVELADYSVSTLEHFRKFLKAKYKTDAALSAAWQGDYTFDSITFPERIDRQRADGNPDVPRMPILSINNKNARCSDFNTFLSWSNARRQVAFCEGLKAGSDNRLLAGSYWPALPATYPLCHNSNYQLLESPAVDFISRGGQLGSVLHGKLTVAEYDLRNVASGLAAWCDYDHPFHAKSQGEFYRQALAGFALQFANGGGFHYWDMWGGWAWRPDTVELLKKAFQTASAGLSDQPGFQGEYIGIFVDDVAADHLMNLGWFYNLAAVERWVVSMGLEGVALCMKAGVPVRMFLLEDALNPELDVPKVAIFPNALTMTLNQAERIRDRFERDNRTVVYCTAPGLAAPGTPDNPSIITGFNIAENPATVNRGLTVVDSEDPLLENIRGGLLLGNYQGLCLMESTTSFAALPDSPGTVLANFAGTDLPGMLVDRSNNCTKVWMGAPGAFTPQLFRNFAKAAGIEPMLENNSSLIYGCGMLGVIGTPAGGPQKLRIPDGAKVVANLTGTEYTQNGNYLEFTLPPADVYGHVALFKIEFDKETDK